MIVKCKYCKNEIDKKTAYAVEYLTKSLNVKHRYYCDVDCEHKEFMEKEKKTKLKEIEKSARESVRDILGLNTDKNIYFSKMYKDLRITFGDELIYEYILNQRTEIENVLETKDFATTNSKVKYFFAMAQNNIEVFNNNRAVTRVENRKTTTVFDDFEIIEVVNTDKKRSINDIMKNM